MTNATETMRDLFGFTEREQTIVMAALQRHWAANTENGRGLHPTEASDEISALMSRLHAERIASFLIGSQNSPAESTFGGANER